ncbi:MAG: hypothetical protein VYA34_05220 [Myxococcota bacterium]|nr:hypothetical protein [Myxococcota bacterium]
MKESQRRKYYILALSLATLGGAEAFAGYTTLTVADLTFENEFFRHIAPEVECPWLDASVQQCDNSFGWGHGELTLPRVADPTSEGDYNRFSTEWRGTITDLAPGNFVSSIWAASGDSTSPTINQPKPRQLLLVLTKEINEVAGGNNCGLLIQVANNLGFGTANRFMGVQRHKGWQGNQTECLIETSTSSSAPACEAMASSEWSSFSEANPNFTCNHIDSYRYALDVGDFNGDGYEDFVYLRSGQNGQLDSHSRFIVGENVTSGSCNAGQELSLSTVKEINKDTSGNEIEEFGSNRSLCVKQLSTSDWLQAQLPSSACWQIPMNGDTAVSGDLQNTGGQDEFVLGVSGCDSNIGSNAILVYKDLLDSSTRSTYNILFSDHGFQAVALETGSIEMSPNLLTCEAGSVAAASYAYVSVAANGVTDSPSNVLKKLDISEGSSGTMVTVPLTGLGETESIDRLVYRDLTGNNEGDFIVATSNSSDSIARVRVSSTDDGGNYKVEGIEATFPERVSFMASLDMDGDPENLMDFMVGRNFGWGARYYYAINRRSNLYHTEGFVVSRDLLAGNNANGKLVVDLSLSPTFDNSGGPLAELDIYISNNGSDWQTYFQCTGIACAYDAITTSLAGKRESFQSFGKGVFVGIRMKGISTTTLGTQEQALTEKYATAEKELTKNSPILRNIQVTPRVVDSAVFSRSALAQRVSGNDFWVYSSFFNFPCFEGGLKAYKMSERVTSAGVDPNQACGNSEEFDCGWTSGAVSGWFDNDSGEPTWSAVISASSGSGIAGLKELVASDAAVRTEVLGNSATQSTVSTLLTRLKSGYKDLTSGNNSTAESCLEKPPMGDGDWTIRDPGHQSPLVVAGNYAKSASGVELEIPYYIDKLYPTLKSSYISHQENLKNNPRVYLGTNGGAIYSFDAALGGEPKWAYVPENLLSKLQEQTADYHKQCSANFDNSTGKLTLADGPIETRYRHQYFIDGNITQVTLPTGSRNEWKTLALVSQGQGLGKDKRNGSETVDSYWLFALDVTQDGGAGTEAPKPLWEFTDSAGVVTTCDPNGLKPASCTSDCDMDCTKSKTFMQTCEGSACSKYGNVVMMDVSISPNHTLTSVQRLEMDIASDADGGYVEMRVPNPGVAPDWCVKAKKPKPTLSIVESSALTPPKLKDGSTVFEAPVVEYSFEAAPRAGNPNHTVWFLLDIEASINNASDLCYYHSNGELPFLWYSIDSSSLYADDAAGGVVMYEVPDLSTSTSGYIRVWLRSKVESLFGNGLHTLQVWPLNPRFKLRAVMISDDSLDGPDAGGINDLAKTENGTPAWKSLTECSPECTVSCVEGAPDPNNTGCTGNTQNCEVPKYVDSGIYGLEGVRTEDDTLGNFNYCEESVRSPADRVEQFTAFGQTFSKPAVGPVEVGGSTKWLAFMGSGTNRGIRTATATIGRSIYAIDICSSDDCKTTPTKIGQWLIPDLPEKSEEESVTSLPTIPTASICETGDGNQCQITNYRIGTGLSTGKVNIENAVPGAPSLVDVDGDGIVDRAYFGDLEGRLWRLKFDPTATWATFGAKSQLCVIFDAGDHDGDCYSNGVYNGNLDTCARNWAPIVTRPAVAVIERSKPNVYFGTGADDRAPDEPVLYRFYSVQDNEKIVSGSDCPRVKTTKDLRFSKPEYEWVVGDGFENTYPLRPLKCELSEGAGGERYWSDPVILDNAQIFFASLYGDIDTVDPFSSAQVSPDRTESRACSPNELAGGASAIYGYATRPLSLAGGRRVKAGESLFDESYYATGAKIRKQITILGETAGGSGWASNQSRKVVGAKTLLFQRFSKAESNQAPLIQTAATSSVESKICLEQWREVPLD